MIFERGEPLYYTLRKCRPEAWQAWENQVRPNNGFYYAVEAKKVIVKIYGTMTP